MTQERKTKDLSREIKAALDKASKKVLEEQKAINGFMVMAGKDGKIIKVPARDM